MRYQLFVSGEFFAESNCLGVLKTKTLEIKYKWEIYMVFESSMGYVKVNSQVKLPKKEIAMVVEDKRQGYGNREIMRRHKLSEYAVLAILKKEGLTISNKIKNER